MARTGTYSAVASEGDLLPGDMLERIAAGEGVEGLRAEDYHLAPGERVREAVSRSWNRMLGAWAGFQERLTRLGEHAPATTETRERWLLVLFQEFGYGRLLGARGLDIGDRSYPISHLWGQTPIHLVGAGIGLDERSSGIAGAARQSPHALVQEFLNRSEDHLWGMASNGLRLRLLRNNVSLTRPAYLEFDLEAIFTGELYPEFLLLWLVCHESRVEAPEGKPHECWLERWHEVAAEQGVRAREHLRSGVEQAINALGTGFLRHRDNAPLRRRLNDGDLGRQDYYRQLLRLVYRLLFLFVAEDRDLLLVPAAAETARQRYDEYYSTRRLRRLAEYRRGGPHGDLYAALRVVMAQLGSDEGCPPLGLPALGSMLWADVAVPDLAEASLGNDALLAAVRELAFVRDGAVRRVVNYRLLDAEELGSVYESLLELHPQMCVAEQRFELATTSGHERKTTGSYYTPDQLIVQLLDTALDPVLDEAVRSADPAQAILALKVMDPACGSGHFLVAVARRMAKRLAAVRTGEDEPAPAAVRAAMRQVVGGCLYGVDVNDMALEIAKFNLWLEALEPGKPLSFLDGHLKVGNSLLGTTPALVAEGIPDAAFKAIHGDEKKVASALRRRNREERGGQQSLLAAEGGVAYDVVSGAMAAVDAMDDNSAEGVREKEARWRAVAESRELAHLRLVADAWCAAFVWPKRAGAPDPVTEDGLRRLKADATAIPPRTLFEIRRLRHDYGFFHWHVEFPGVFHVADPDAADNPATGWPGGFDVVLGNPPYGRLSDKALANVTRHKHPSASTAANTAAAFIALSLTLCQPKGLVGLVIPKSFTYSYAWEPLRNALAHNMASVVDVSRAWDEVLLEQVLLTLTPRRTVALPKLGRALKRAKTQWSEGITNPLMRRVGTIPTGLSTVELRVVNTILEESSYCLGDIARTRRGTNIQSMLLPAGGIPALAGRDLESFNTPSPTRFLDERPTSTRICLTNPPQVVFQNIVAHISRPCDHIRVIGTVVEHEYACVDTVNLVEATDPEWTPWALAAYLMTNVVNWFLYVCAYNRAVRTMHFDGYFLNKVPMAKSLSPAELHRQGRAIHQDPRGEAGWRELNELVYRGFKISTQARSYLNSVHKGRWASP